MIEEKHRAAALAALADDAELEEVIPPDVWALLVREGQVEHVFKGKRAAGLRLTAAGLAFLKRTLQRARDPLPREGD